MKSRKRKTHGQRQPSQKTPDAHEIEKAKQQLGTWVSAQTPVLMIVFGPFFSWSIRGQLRRSMTDGRNDFFHLHTAESLFGAAIVLDLAESVTMENDGGIWVKGPCHQILVAEFHDEASLERALLSSGGRVN